MTASQRIADLNAMDARDLCAHADTALVRLVDILNRETTLLRTGHLRAAAELSAEKAVAAQDYTILARTVQREAARLKLDAPDDLERLHAHHESFATQMAENLRVLATARAVTEDLLTDVARAVGATESPRTYGARGAVNATNPAASGLAVNRAL